jgi:hypothetical protein
LSVFIIMTTKEDLVGYIREWISLDNEIKECQKLAKDRRTKKKAVTDLLIDIMKTNEIDCFDVKNGKLMYAQNKVRAPLSKKHLLNCLQSYFAEHPDIQGADVVDHILDSREVKMKDNIRRKIGKLLED